MKEEFKQMYLSVMEWFERKGIKTGNLDIIDEELSQHKLKIVHEIRRQDKGG